MDVSSCLAFSVLTISTFVSCSLSERECGRLEYPLNGRVIIDTYRVGGVARYSCNKGYRLQGHSAALCMSDGEFDPSHTPICRPVMCEEVYHFENGNIQHINDGRQSYSYMTINMYRCNPGFRIKGPSNRRCGGDGEWEGDDPFCQEITCVPLGPLFNGEIDYSERRRTWGTVAIFTCNTDSDLFPSDKDMAMCEETGEWSDSAPECFRKAIIGPTTRGYVYVDRSSSPLRQRKSVKHGTKVRLTCDSRSELYSTVPYRRYINQGYVISRNYNGTWTPALSECVFKRCDLREKKYKRYEFTFINGTAAPPKVDHNTELHGRCITNFEFQEEYDETPSLFTCNKGNIFLEQRCVPAFCSVALEDGMYLDTGTTEIIDDIKRIRHRTKVYYRCSNNREYELFHIDYTDTVSDTCSYGRWVKNVRPVCKEKRCTLQVYEGAVFSDHHNNIIDSNRSIESGRNIHIKCNAGFRMFKEGHPVRSDILERYSTCSKGKWSNILTCEPEPCYLDLQYYEDALLYDDRHSRIQSSKNIESGKSIRINCIDGYRMTEKGQPAHHENSLTCSGGTWSSTNLKCEPAPCDFVKRVGSDFWLEKDGNKHFLNTRKHIKSNTRVYIRCHTGYRLTLTRGTPGLGELVKYSNCYRGRWDRIYECEEEPCHLNVYEGALFYDEYNNKILSNQNIMSNKNIRIKCEHGFRMLTGGRPVRNEQLERFVTCTKGNWSTNLQCEPVGCGPGQWQCSDGQCIDVAQRCDSYPDCEDESDEVCNVTVCNEGLVACPQPNGFIKCVEDTHGCAVCNFTKHIGSDYWLIEDGRKQLLHESGPIQSNTRVFISCHVGYRLMLASGIPVRGESIKYCYCYRGKWKSPVYKCVKVMAEFKETTAEFEETNTKTVLQNFSSTLSQKTSQIISITGSSQSTRIETEMAAHQDDASEPTSGAANLYEYTTTQTRSLSTENVLSTSTLAYDGSQIDVVSTNTTAQAQFDATMDYFDETTLKAGCLLPPRLNADVYQISGEYLPGENVPHEYSFDVTCYDDYEPLFENLTVTCNDGEWEDMPNCVEESGSDGLPNCTVAYGSAKQLTHNPLLFEVSCNHGYNLNNIAEFFTCQDGHFYPDGLDPDLSSSTGHVECLPENCLVPFNMSSDMKVQNKNGTYYSRGSIISHKEKILVSCQEGFEPYKKEFRCVAGEFQAISTKGWTFDANSNGTIYCRKAKCNPGCGSGVCILDDTCQCDDGHYGTHCEKAFCSVTLGPGMYVDTRTSEMIDDIERIRHNTEIFYRCSNDKDYELYLKGYTDSVSDTCSYGQWVKKVTPVCKERRCYLHVYEGVVFSDEQRNDIHSSRFIESGRSIHINCKTGFSMVDEGHPTPSGILERSLMCSKGKLSRNLRCEQAKCEPGCVSGVCIRDNTCQCDDGHYGTHCEKEYNRAYIYKHGVWIYHLYPEWEMYSNINSLQLCEFTCNNEAAFTCMAIVFYPDRSNCYTLSYSTVDHPEYFIYYSFFTTHYYERTFAPSK